MSIYVYRQRRSTGARELAGALGGIRLRQIDGVRSLVRGDTVVCWGERMEAREGVIILNGGPMRNKFEDATILRAANVPTIEVSRTRPTTPAPVTGPPPPDPALSIWEDAKDSAETFDSLEFARGPVMIRALTEMEALFGRLRVAINTPAPARVTLPAVNIGEWVPRRFNHTGGLDLLNLAQTGQNPDFWAKKETFVNEYRIHSFNGRSIRAGQKVPREGMTPHAWVRSFDGGWRISYDGFESTRIMRDLSAAAVTALGLQFGAVDLAMKADGTYVVLEVNRAPGLEGGTVLSYAQAIRTMLDGGTRPRA